MIVYWNTRKSTGGPGPTPGPSDPNPCIEEILSTVSRDAAVNSQVEPLQRLSQPELLSFETGLEICCPDRNPPWLSVRAAISGLEIEELKSTLEDVGFLSQVEVIQIETMRC